ncbi:MAG: hypothetical protein ACOX8I_05885 [Bacillota bacterium]
MEKGSDPKIKVTTLLKEACAIYLRNLNPLLCLSTISALVSVGCRIYIIYFAHIYYKGISVVGPILFIIADSLIGIWISMTLFFAAASILNGDNKRPFSKSLIIPRSRFWKCLLTTIGFAIGRYVPFGIIGLLPDETLMSPGFVVFLFVFALIYVIQFYAKYQFAVTSAVLESKATDAFENSEKLAQGYYGKVLSAALIVGAIPLVTRVLNILYRINALGIENSFVTSIVGICCTMLVKPLTTTFLVLLYRRLKEVKGIASFDAVQSNSLEPGIN